MIDGPVVETGTNAFIGAASSADKPSDAAIDEVAVYASVLESSQLQQIFSTPGEVNRCELTW